MAKDSSLNNSLYVCCIGHTKTVTNGYEKFRQSSPRDIDGSELNGAATKNIRLRRKLTLSSVLPVLKLYVPFGD